MKIKQKLQIIFLSLIAFSLFLGIIVIYFGNELQKNIEKTGKYDIIIKSMNDLNVLTFEFVNFRLDRTISQWNNRWDKINGNISKILEEYGNENEKKIIPGIIDDLKNMKKMFDFLSSDELLLEPKFLKELETNAQSRININSIKIFDSINHIYSGIYDEINTQQNQRRFASFFFIFFVILSNSIIYLVYVKSVMKPLEIVTEEMKLIGKGDLNRRITVKNRDEIGLVAENFNNMVSNLREVTASKTELDDLLTQLKKANEDLLLKNIVFESSVAANSIADIQGNIISVNKAFLKLWAYKDYESSIGRSVADFFVDMSEAGKVLESLNTDGEWQGEFRAKRSNGEKFISRGFATTIKDMNGNHIGYQSSNIDVTKERQAAEEIKDLNRTLESKVEQRTAQLQETNKELESFSYTVSHDLRAPLRMIMGYSNILVEDYNSKLDDEGRETIDTIVRNTQRMQHLIDDILEFSRMGRREIKPEKLGTKEIFESKYSELVNLEAGRNISFNIDELPEITADKVLFELLAQNLLDNAIKFTSKKENAVIKVTGKVTDNILIIVIEDNGVGFEEKYKDKMFGVFQRLHSDEEFKGTGVGLAIVQRVVTKHGWSIDAESKVGEGAKFYLKIPINNL